MWRRGVSLLCALVMAAAPVAAQGACYAASDDGAITEGRLIERDDAIILKLPQPACLKGDEDSDNIPASAEIHVYALEDGLQETLRSLIGKDVHLRGSLMGAHTQHHKAPIVMRAREADEI
jgi:hypothetical protein